MAQKLSYKNFLLSLKLAPRLAVELLVRDADNKVFLTKRKDFPFEGHWHTPGCFLLKGELLSDCIERLAKEELGIAIDPTETKFLGIFETLKGDPRDAHALHYVVEYKMPLKDATLAIKTKGQFFSRIPENVIPYQEKYLVQAFS